MADARIVFQEYIKQIAGQYQNIQTVRLGKLDGATVQTGVAGELWARQWNNKEIKVRNRAMIAADFDTRVLVGSTALQPNIWFILITMEDYLTPTAGGRIGYHELQHEFDQPDMVPIDRRQIIAMSMMVSDAATWKVQLYGGVFQGLTGMVLVDNQIIDFTAYICLAGAYYVSVFCDDTGVLSYQIGTNFGAPDACAVSYVSLPAPGKYLIGYVIFFEAQTLVNEHIRVVMPLGMVPKTGGLQIHEAVAALPNDLDEFGFWDVVNSLIRKITWQGLLSLITTWVQAYIHVHGLARWNGALGQTVFEYPDVVDAIQEVTINGLEEDPLVYSLSSDGTQLVLDTALASASTVISRYMIRKI